MNGSRVSHTQQKSADQGEQKTFAERNEGKDDRTRESERARERLGNGGRDGSEIDIRKNPRSDRRMGLVRD